MYVANTEADSISVIDTATNTIIETIYTGDGPIAIEFNPNNNDMYVANEISNTVSVVDTSSVTPPPPAENPRTIADILKSILENPLDIANSLDSANEIKEILTDDDRDNDQLVCDLMNGLSQGQMDSIRSILNCE
jgi:YVTN family beta-propeller protein